LIKGVFPGSLVAPYLVLGGTDARHYASVTENAFRFTPVEIDKQDLKSVHGVNERLSFENCSKMVGYYIAYIQELSSLPAEVDIAPVKEETALETEEEELMEEVDETLEEKEETLDEDEESAKEKS